MAEQPPLKPGTAALGCAVLGGGTIASFVWLLQGFLVPYVADGLNVEISITGWMAVSLGMAVLTGVVLFFMSRRAFAQQQP